MCKTKTPDWNDLKHGTVVVVHSLSKRIDSGFKWSRVGHRVRYSAYFRTVSEPKLQSLYTIIIGMYLHLHRLHMRVVINEHSVKNKVLLVTYGCGSVVLHASCQVASLRDFTKVE